MSFKDIAGNEQAKRILQLSLSKGRLPNSLLFFGPSGTGKLKTALTLAKALNCERRQDDSCDLCESCLRAERGQHPNIRLVVREKNREQIVKDQVEEINYLSNLRPWNQGRMVFIIDEAEKMNETVANSLLKTLEEPHPFVYFILITEDLQLILPTMRSRCQVMRFNPLTQEELEKTLLARGLSPDQAKLMAITSRDDQEALQERKWEEFIQERNLAFTLFKKLLESEEPSDFLDWASMASRKDLLARYRGILQLFAVFFRDILAIKEGSREQLLNPDLAPEIEKMANLISVEGAVRGVGGLEDFLARLKKNPNLSIISNELVIFLREIKNV